MTINLRECVVEDFDAASQPSQKRSTQKLDAKSAAVSLLIRISHKVCAHVCGQSKELPPRMRSSARKARRWHALRGLACSACGASCARRA